MASVDFDSARAMASNRLVTPSPASTTSSNVVTSRFAANSVRRSSSSNVLTGLRRRYRFAEYSGTRRRSRSHLESLCKIPYEKAARGVRPGSAGQNRVSHLFHENWLIQPSIGQCENEVGFVRKNEKMLPCGATVCGAERLLHGSHACAKYFKDDARTKVFRRVWWVHEAECWWPAIHLLATATHLFKAYILRLAWQPWRWQDFSP